MTVNDSSATVSRRTINAINDYSLIDLLKTSKDVPRIRLYHTNMILLYPI